MATDGRALRRRRTSANSRNPRSRSRHVPKSPSSVAAADSVGSPANRTQSTRTPPAPANPVLFPADGTPSGFELSRDHFVAGYADRFVYTRSYIPLICSYWTTTIADHSKILRLMMSVGTPGTQAVRRVFAFVKNAAKLGAQFEKKVKTGSDIRFRDVRGVLESAWTATVPSNRAAARGKGQAKDQSGHMVFQPAPGGVVFASAGPSPAGAPANQPDAFAGLQAVVTQAGPTGREHLKVGIAEGVTSTINLGWLGILFYDRLRLRPAGLVAGDQVYSLSLAPGEEVALTQKSETKRSKSFEEVLDQTTEQELEFNSTWSTNVSQQDANSQTSTLGGNLGVSVGGSIDGVNVGVNAGVSASDSNTISQTLQQAKTLQVTTRATTKAKEEHKTTFRISTDVTEEFGSKRVLRNTNPAHGLTLNFYKLYEKYRILLERYDAKLCTSFYIDDPGKDLRGELQDELSKLDPQNIPPGSCPGLPPTGTVDVTHEFDSSNSGHDSSVTLDFSTILTAGTVLSSFSFTLVSWRVQRTDGTQYQADVSQFGGYGGTWGFKPGTVPPIVGSNGAQSVWIDAYLPWGGFFNQWWTVNIVGTFEWSYVPDSAFTTEIQKCIADEKQKIRDSFSSARVSEILAEVQSGLLVDLYKRLYEEVLLAPYYAQGIDPPLSVLEELRNDFDWNEATVEYLPWWMTIAGRRHREELRQLLLGLPGDAHVEVSIPDALVASGARLYLPIKEGQEYDAVYLIAQLEGEGLPDLSKCIQDFIDWRDKNLGPNTYPLPTWQQVTAPGDGMGTATEQIDWSNDWERAPKKFLVLSQWADQLPTDGVHVEPVMSTGSSMDAFRTSALLSDLKTAAALQDLDEAQAALEGAVAAKGPKDATIVIGDPAARRP